MIRPIASVIVALSVMAASPCGIHAAPIMDADPATTRTMVLEIPGEELLDRLHGLWLAETIGNWTGLTTEGARGGHDLDGDGLPDVPFLADADWGKPASQDRLPAAFQFHDVWGADDDTDIEYLYLDLMTQHGPILTPRQIADGWREHVRDHVWGSNKMAQLLMDRGVEPPATSTPSGNWGAWFIDAQLTTELFGALAPGLPEEALRISALPISVTARGHAAHAAQFHLLLRTFAPLTDPAAPMPKRIRWMVEESAAYLPVESKSRDIIRFVLAEYDRVPRPRWENARDVLWRRYQNEAYANGFFYIEWYESSVNMGTALIALLWGEGDLPRTIQIGTLAGWDSDNGTATMAGLLGYMLGYDGVSAAFPGVELSDRYNVSRTRVGFPDRVPDDPLADDMLLGIAERSRDVAARVIGELGGGTFDTARNVYTIPVVLPPRGLAGHGQDAHATMRTAPRSANVQVRLHGGDVTATLRGAGREIPGEMVRTDLASVCDGAEFDDSGRDIERLARYFAAQSPTDSAAHIVFDVVYTLPVPAEEIAVLLGDMQDGQGGWPATLKVELRTGGRWSEIPVTLPADVALPYRDIRIPVSPHRMIDALRVSMTPGGRNRTVTVSEIDAMGTWAVAK